MIILLTVCGCVHRSPELTLDHDIRVPKEWRTGATLPVSFISGTSEIERYIAAYDEGWWWCAVHHARNIEFQPLCSDYFISGHPSRTYGGAAGVGDAQARIEKLIRAYGTHNVSDLLSEFREIKLSDE